MLTTPLSSQNFRQVKYNFSDYNGYRSTPVAYYNDNSKRKSIASLAEIVLSGETDDFKQTTGAKEISKKKPKLRLFQELDKISQVIAKTYNVFVAQKINRFREFTDKIL